MRLSRFFAFAALGFALSPLGCSSVEDEGEAEAAPETSVAELNGIAITEADNGRTVTVTEGRDVIVRLPSNPTTGYTWQVVSTDPTFGYPSKTFIPGSAATGSGGIEQFTWKTKSFRPMVGAHTVAMEYRRPWENRPLKTFRFTVKIVPNQCPPAPPPVPGFCYGGQLKPRTDENGCTVGYDCERGCSKDCGPGRSCQNCRGTFVCLPNGSTC